MISPPAEVQRERQHPALPAFDGHIAVVKSTNRFYDLPTRPNLSALGSFSQVLMGRCTIAAAMTDISLILGKTGGHLSRLRAVALALREAPLQLLPSIFSASCQSPAVELNV